MSLSFLEQQAAEYLDTLEQKKLLRSLDFFCPKTFIDFATNDYLSLRCHQTVIEGGITAARKYGAGSGASRIVADTNESQGQVEEYFCAKLGYKHALFFPNGFNANLNFFDSFSFLNNKKECLEFFIDSGAHASLFLGLRAAKFTTHIFRHDDYVHLFEKTKKSSAQIKIIVVESIHSMNGTFLNAEEIKKICEKNNCLLYVDESHSFGIMGPSGKGFIEKYADLKPYLLAAMFGCGKAVGASGAILAMNSSSFFQNVIQNAKGFMFSTAVSPFITGAVFAALQIIFNEEGNARREKLYYNISYFSESLVKSKLTKNSQISQTPIIPFIIGDNSLALSLSKQLMQKKLFVKCMRSPSVPKNTARLRITLRSELSLINIDHLVDFLAESVSSGNF